MSEEMIDVFKNGNKISLLQELFDFWQTHHSE